MIVKMKFLTITGPKDSLNRVIENYLYEYEFQLENALTELKNVQNLKPYLGISPYKDLYVKSEELLKLVDITNIDPNSDEDISFEDAGEVINQMKQLQEEYSTKQKAIADRLKTLKTYAENLKQFNNFDYSVQDVLNFKFIKLAFGKMPKEYYLKYKKYLEDEIDAIFIKCEETEFFVWGTYFSPEQSEDKTNSLFSSLHFERISIPSGYEGTASEVSEQIDKEIAEYTAKEKEVIYNYSINTAAFARKLYLTNKKLARLSNNFDVRKMVACTEENHTNFFILCGWMPSAEARKLEKDISQDPDIYVIENAQNLSTITIPPTKLKNPRIFRPFEMFIEMYGLPNYRELDPTIFVALTYALIFGIMFGDVGQGLCLVIGGYLLYKFKNMRLAAIISCAGVFSTIFGFMFGSVFGFENIIEAIWLRPGKEMISLPFIGNINFVLVAAVAFGMFLILVTMIMHIINGIRTHNIGDLLFDTSAMSGIVFYFSLVLVIVLFMTGNPLPGGIVLAIMFGIPLILIALKEPLTNIIEKRSEILPKDKGMFIVQTFFEMFEVLLSYFSNTISFVRIGAFAISHAAMMEVVLMLAGAESGNVNWIVIIIGNLFVCGLEGLIVGIQVLRLEYYEMFSRFYIGGGRAFKPFNPK